MENSRLNPTELTVIASSVTIEGNLEASNELHLYGKVIGEIRCKPGSTLVLKEGSLVEGKIFADQLIVDGFAKGQIEATGKVWITSLGKVTGNIKTGSLQVDPGAIFEARVGM
jgi:cytoskeletal protein CcmA (bactofilin family)